MTQPTILDLYQDEEYLSIPGVSKGLLQSATADNPDYRIVDRGNGTEGVFYRSKGGMQYLLGDRPKVVPAATTPETDQPGFGEVPQPGSFPKFARGVADTSAGLLKGAVQGFVGLPGDLEEIGRLLVNLAGGDVSEESYLATTNDIKKILDRYAPLKAKMGEGDQTIVETIGELASPGGYLKNVKAATKSATARKAGKRAVAAGGASATIKQSQQEPN